jgi:APA family basic amino acid/polyamine antiporter
MSALRPSLGLTHATAMVVGTIIGASIFVQPSEITKLMPSVSGILLVWLAAGVLTLAGALVCAELASAFPQTGGVYVFLKEAYSPALGFLWGWAMFWSMHSGIIAAIATVFARYAAQFVPLTDTGLRLVAVSVIVGLSAVNYVGVRHGGLIQNVFTAAKVLAILAIVSAGLVWHGPAHAVASAGVGAGDLSVRGLILAIAAGLFAYGGWHMVTYTAGETKDPARTIPRALLIGTLIVTACYAGLNAIYLRVLPLDAVRASTRVAADAADVLFGGGGASIMAALVMVSTFGAVNGIILVGPRVYYSMARDRLLFKSVGAVHPVFGTPHRAIVLQAIWSSALALTNTYGALFSRVIYTEWIFFALMAAGLMRLRRRPDYRPSYRIVGYPLVPVTFVVASVVIVAIQMSASPRDSLIGMAIVIAGLPVYGWWSRARSDTA